jgi:hypothetical protein
MLATIQLRLFVHLSLIPPQKKLKIRMYKTIISHVALYVCETWSFLLTKEYALRVFGNRVLRRIFGPKREKVAGSWR